jgi:hypothetical protein
MITDPQVVSRISIAKGRCKLCHVMPNWNHVVNRRGRLTLMVCLLGAVLSLAGAVPSLAADQVEIRSGAHAEYGRLVFQWPESSGFDARIEGQQLRVRFDRSFDADFGPALRTLRAYISNATHEPDSTTVQFDLTEPFGLRSGHYDTSVVLDLLRVNAAGPAPSTEQRAGTPGVRVGEHSDFTRVVFDWAENVNYNVQRRGERLTVSFGTPGAPDLSRFERAPPRLIKSAVSRKTEVGLAVVFAVDAGTSERHFRDGNRVVVDILPGTGAAPTRQNARANPSEPRRPAAAPTVAVATRPAPDSMLPSDAYRLKLGVATMPKGVRLTFPWDNLTPAAVFQRADYLWVVFDRPSRADFSALTAEYSDRLITAEQLNNRHSTVLRFKIPADRYISAIRSELDWVVDLTTTPSQPAHPLLAERELDVHGGARIFVPAVDTGNSRDLRDPEVGDTLVVVPILSPGHGMAQERLFAEFHLLASAQGVVVQPLSERVSVDPRRNGVRITGEDGLILSTGRLPVKLDMELSSDVPVIQSTHESPDGTDQMIDVTTWQGDSDKPYRNSRNELMGEIAAAHEGDRNALRWDMARFLFAHEQAQDAIGVLDVIAAEDRSAEVETEYLVLRGATNFLLRRYDEATEDLGNRSLEAEPHAALWRSALLSAQKEWADAKQEYSTGAEVLKYYGRERQIEFRLAAAEAAIMTNDVTMLKVELSGIEVQGLSEGLRAKTALYRGHFLEMSGEHEAAQEQFGLVVAGGYRPIAARAELALLNLRAKNGDLDIESKIKALEQLRYRWRGGDLELEVLHELGRLYVDSRDPAGGLQTMRRAITFFPDSSRAPGIANDMNQVFRDLFLDGAADQMSEVSALALYYEFRELTPAGTDGDDMIRKLSDRLVAVDLLVQAAELLDHQVKYRLRGQDKAKVGAKLAVVYLLDQQPREALRALRMSRYPRVDNDIKTERRHLEARSLAETERRSEALRALEGDNSTAAEQIRADVFWSAKDWPRAAELIESLLDDGSAGAELAAAERFQVMRVAVAYALAGDRAGLDRVRDRFSGRMDQSPDKAPFQILTRDVFQTDGAFRELAGKIASVSTLETFMSSYRDKIDGGDGVTAN